MSDFEDDAPSVTAIPQEAISRVSLLCQQLLMLSNQRNNMEEQLKNTKEEIRKLTEERIPDVMQQLGFESITLEDGSKVALETVYHAEIPKAKAHEAFAWLRQHNYDSLIKNEVKAMFGKGEDQLAAKLTQFAMANKIDITTKQAVHPQTLKAFVREKAEAGAPVPVDLFGVHIQKQAKLTNRS